MADESTPSASQPLSSDNTVPFTYKPLGLPSLASPGAPLQSASLKQPGGAAMTQAAALYAAEQARIAANDAAFKAADAAKLAAANNRRGK